MQKSQIGFDIIFLSVIICFLAEYGRPQNTVTPAKAGSRKRLKKLDSSCRRNDALRPKRIFFPLVRKKKLQEKGPAARVHQEKGGKKEVTRRRRAAGSQGIFPGKEVP